MAEIAYFLAGHHIEVDPVDPDTGRDIEGLGMGTIVEIWVPDSRRDDVDRNDTTRRELTAIIEASIASIEAG